MSALLRKKPVHQVVVCTEYGLYLLLRKLYFNVVLWYNP